MTSRVHLSVFLPACFSIACSSSSSGSPAGGSPTFDSGGATFDSGADAAKESGPATDGGSGEASTTGDAGGGIVRALLGAGESTLVQTSSSDVFTGGQFAVYAASDPCPSPTELAMGCTINDCATPSKPQKYLSAGTLTMTGGNPSVTMTQNSQGTYRFSQQVGEFAGNGMLTFKATGGDVPAFTVSIPQIGYISLTSPAPNAKVPHSQDLVLTWTGGTSGTFAEVEMTTIPKHIVCLFDSAAGTGTIPGSMLSQLTVDPNGNQIDAYEYVQTTAMAGSIPILVQNTHDDFGADHIGVFLQ